MSERLLHEHDVKIPMRDGLCLTADVWRPDGADPLPVLVSRTPYGKDMAAQMSAPDQLAAAGYAVVVQDCRGRFGSDGEWTYVHSEVDDGYDTVEWAADQPWSNGRVGMFGASYMGYTQWLAAVARPPHLVSIAPECCAADYWMASFDSGGAFRLALRIGWTASVVSSMTEVWGIEHPLLDALSAAALRVREATVSGDAAAIRDAREQAKQVMAEVYLTRPIKDNPLWHGRATWLDEIFDHESRDDANWRRVNPMSHYDELDLPAVHVGGWYDIQLDGILGNFTGMRRQAPTERARREQHLVVGPWAHWAPMVPVVGDVDFGPDAVFDTTRMRLEWFAHTLQGGPAPDWPPVRIFVMGENRWRDEQEWPLGRTSYTPWYLRSDGRLTDTRPAVGEPAEHFVYDPRDPVPTRGGRLLGMGEVGGPVDQGDLVERADVLVYTSAPLDTDLEITGPVTMDLWVATDAPDTDFTAILVEVHPGGVAYNLAEGVVRLRHADLPRPLEADAAYRVTIDLSATSIVVPRGNALRLQVSSSSFPEWEPNPNTGNPIGADTDDDLRVAHQTVFHDANHPSRIVLPVIPR